MGQPFASFNSAIVYGAPTDCVVSVLVSTTPAQAGTHSAACVRDLLRLRDPPVLILCCCCRYLTHPYIFKHLFHDKKLQDCLHSPAMVPILQFKWTHHTARLFRAELYLYVFFVALTTMVSLLMTTHTQVVTYADQEYHHWDTNRAVEAFCIFIQWVISVGYAFRHAVHL